LQESTRTIKGTVSTRPELGVTPNGKPFTKFDVEIPVINPDNGVPEDVSVHVKTWNVLAENAEKYVNVGQELALSGRWDTREYTDKSGDLRKWTEFIAFGIKRNNVRLGDNGFVLPTKSVTQESDAGVSPPWLNGNGELNVNTEG
jgi:single-stranded DNA-binding protein